MERRRAEHGVEGVGERQVSAVGADEEHAGRQTIVADRMRPLVPDVLRRGLIEHRRRAIDADDEAVADRGEQLGRQPPGAAAEIENALARARRQPLEHAPAPPELRIRQSVIALRVPVSHRARAQPSQITSVLQSATCARGPYATRRYPRSSWCRLWRSGRRAAAGADSAASRQGPAARRHRVAGSRAAADARRRRRHSARRRQQGARTAPQARQRSAAGGIPHDAHRRSLGGRRRADVTYHYYPAFLEYPGSTSLSLDYGARNVVDVVRSLARYGPRRFYVLNTGVSTVRALEPAAAALAADGVLLRYTDLSARLEAAARGMREQAGGTHADEVETSMMLSSIRRASTCRKAVKDYASVERRPEADAHPRRRRHVLADRHLGRPDAGDAGQGPRVRRGAGRRDPARTSKRCATAALPARRARGRSGAAAGTGTSSSAAARPGGRRQRIAALPARSERSSRSATRTPRHGPTPTRSGSARCGPTTATSFTPTARVERGGGSSRRTASCSSRGRSIAARGIR